MRITTLLLFSFFFIGSGNAQEPRFSLGPEFTLFGAGIGASLRVLPAVSVSADLAMMPSQQLDATVEDMDVSSNVAARGGLIMVSLHPGRGKFSVGGGILLGGYSVSASASPSGGVTIGETYYTEDMINRFVGKATVGGPAPTALLGWRGRGFNFGLGAVFSFVSTLSATAHGLAASDATLSADIDRELREVDALLHSLPVLPYLRMGWQIGF